MRGTLIFNMLFFSPSDLSDVSLGTNDLDMKQESLMSTQSNTVIFETGFSLGIFS